MKRVAKDYVVDVKDFEILYGLDYMESRVQQMMLDELKSIGKINNTFQYEIDFTYSKDVDLEQYITSCHFKFGPSKKEFNTNVPYRRMHIESSSTHICPSDKKRPYDVTITITPFDHRQVLFSYGPAELDFWTDKMIDHAARFYVDQLTTEPDKYLLSLIHPDGDYVLLKSLWHTSTIFRKIKRALLNEIRSSGLFFTNELNIEHNIIHHSNHMSTTMRIR